MSQRPRQHELELGLALDFRRLLGLLCLAWLILAVGLTGCWWAFTGALGAGFWWLQLLASNGLLAGLIAVMLWQARHEKECLQHDVRPWLARFGAARWLWLVRGGTQGAGMLGLVGEEMVFVPRRGGRLDLEAGSRWFVGTLEVPRLEPCSSLAGLFWLGTGPLRLCPPDGDSALFELAGGRRAVRSLLRAWQSFELPGS